ncbi:tripartite tricarboxylate transporter TctB family protein [Nitratireductor sp. ZSWI3]|uniref:tripartite tricarboxylate transporter TctB family protein n=1 Tax=Nitratireductor sp. ZSWI3 TaxID=2966359 RepID=UPI00214F6BEC|nr:tripartite tricarboxylate transporter TctB family protein [Nitratireductor sp. ZSWI3]MCR4266341.1 tripartite tricarboxylate transporter TctB family protein [Nitratireductor sp. ZSWI3]
MGELTRISIDFETSHLVFPAIIAIGLGLLGLAIAIRDRRQILAAGAYWRDVFGKADKPRFFGTIGLTLIYFVLMEPVGRLWPNTGLGFLICSVPYVLLTGLLFMRERTPAAALPVAVTAVVAPAFVWWLFTYPFFLTLP